MSLTNSPLRILVLSPVEPFPPRGWQTIIYYDIKFLAARGHKLTVLATTFQHCRIPREMAEIAEIECFYKFNPSKWLQVIKNIGQSLPYTVIRHYDKHLLAKASELIRSGKIDVVLIEDAVMGSYAKVLKTVSSIPIYLRSHNVSTVVCERFYKSQRNPVLRYLGWRQYLKFFKYESNVVNFFDGVLQLSAADAEVVEKMNPSVKNDVLCAGVDLDYFSVGPAHQRESNVIVHVGTLTPITKLPAMIWFYEKVFPLILERFPDVRLELVGQIPKCKLHHAGPANLVIHGVVPDVRPFLWKGAVFIGPQFVGSGIRIKILNAMATGNAVVATSVACEGIPVTHGRNIMIADDVEGFAEHVSLLLENAKLRERIGRQARLLVEQRFTWPKIAEQLELHFRTAVKRLQCAESK